MALQDFEKLREIVFENNDLQKSLQKIKVREDFILRVIEIGKEFDLRIEREEILEAMRADQRDLLTIWH